MTYTEAIQQIRKTAASEGADRKTVRAAENAVLAHILRTTYRLAQR
jgi:hypothetical protein